MSGTTTPQYGEYIGVESLYYALVTADTDSAYTAGSPVYLAPAANVAADPSVSTKVRHYDNKAYFSTTTEGETKVTMSVSGLPLDVAATLLGRHYDSTAKRLYDTGDGTKAPYVALGFKANVEGGAKFFWYLKGKFAPFKEEAQTVTTDINEKTTSLEFTAIQTVHSKFNVNSVASALKRVVGDNRTDNTITDASWFGSVQFPADVT